MLISNSTISDFMTHKTFTLEKLIYVYTYDGIHATAVGIHNVYMYGSMYIHTVHMYT